MKEENVMKIFDNGRKASIILGVVGGILCLSGIFGTEYIEYGGDAYTGIQNAAADTANNVLKACGALIIVIGIIFGNYCNIKKFEYEESNKMHQELLRALGAKTDNIAESNNVTVSTERESATDFIISNGITRIGVMEFRDCTSLRSLTIPDSVTSIGRGAFYNCCSLTSINFEGTKKQWNAIEKAENWNANTGDYTINCTDGTITE